MRTIVIPDIDGFYGEPAEFDQTLEVDLHIVDAELEDEWFAFDDTQPVEAAFDDMPTTPWQRIGDWFRSLKRAA